MGRLIRLVEEIDLSFDIRSAESNSQTVVLVPRIPSVDCVSGVLTVRLRSKGTWASGARLFVRLRNISWGANEPENVFVNDASNVAEVSLVDTLTAPFLPPPVALTAPIAGAMRCLATWVQGSTGGSAAQTCNIGVDLVVRSG